MKTQTKKRIRFNRFKPSDGTVQRKVAYRLYPTDGQAQKMLDTKGAHCRLYNALLEQRIFAYKRQGLWLSKGTQSAELTAFAREDAEIGRLSAQSRQVTLDRLDLAFQAFFRRVKKGETPGFPRFKSFSRYPGWGYKTHGDGWKLFPGEDGKHGRLRLTGIGSVRIRGGMRDIGTPKTCEITHRNGKWYASVTINCKPQRQAGTVDAAFDWGIEHFLTIERSDDTFEEIENPRWLRRSEAKLKELNRLRDAKKRFTPAWRKVSKRIAFLHSKIARQRKDFQHQLSAKLIAESSAIFTETLSLKNMTKRPKPKPGEVNGDWLPNGAAAKGGLNKAILETAPAQFLSMMRYKAADAGIVFGEAPTQTLKPSQRCRECGVVKKKRLETRIHQCSCGFSTTRDRNAAGVMLDWGRERFVTIWLARHNALGFGTIPESRGSQNPQLELLA